MSALNDSSSPSVNDRDRWLGLYLGWWMVPVAAALMVGTMPGRTHGLGLITKPLLEETGITETRYSLINLVATLVGAIACLPIGKLIDRWGVRILAPGVLLGLGLSVLTISATRNETLLAIAITATRAFGQSMLSVLSLALVGKWFNRRIAAAMGTYSFLMGMGFMLAFGLVGSLIVNFGWRSAWDSMGWTILLAVPFSLLMIRSEPRFGPDDSPSDPRSPSSESKSAPSEPLGKTLIEALQTPAFWSVSLGVSLYGAASSGLMLFQESLFLERGFDAKVYYATLPLGAIVGVVTNLIVGWLMRRSGLRWPLSLALLAQGITLLSFPWVGTLLALYLYVVATAVSGGTLTVIFFSAWARTFGPKHLGQIQGVAQMLTVIFSAIGPHIVARCKVHYGSFSSATTLFASLTLLLALLAALTPIPRWLPEQQRH